MDGSWLNDLAAGDAIELVDTRGAQRRLKAAAVDSGGARAERAQTAYVTREIVQRVSREPPRAPRRETRTAGITPTS